MSKSLDIYSVVTLWSRHIVPSQNKGPAQYLPTSKFVFMNNYSLDIISKVIVLFLDHYSMMKFDFVFVISNINNKIVK